jgi:two-component system sensor histidine kinase/response regulator
MTADSTPSVHLLVVDDQEANVQVMQTLLAAPALSIASAGSGPEALAQLDLQIADLILLDVRMPGMDGFEVCQRIREHAEWADIPIIFLSAAADKRLIVRALEAGGVDYITKPFNQAELVSRVRTHLALKAARDRLKQLAEDKDELLGILAHDLKNHLGGMQMSAQLIHERATALADLRLGRLSGNVLHATEQMLAFVKEFLANASADRGLPLAPAPLVLGATARSVVRQYSEAARRKDIILELQIRDENAVALADREAVDQVLENLISNAIKFSPPGRRIVVGVASLPDGSGEYRVQDEGPGFTAEDRQVIFRRYRRLSARPTAGEPSTGLGLSIVRRLVRDMQGDLQCESEPGNGATFILRLPPVAASVN